MRLTNLLDVLTQGRNPDTVRVARLCLATGARWSEAETLTAGHLYRDRVVYANTKGLRVRTVPITSQLYRELNTGRSGRLFGDCYAAFRAGVRRTGLILPKGQSSHVLRHSFASHFVMNGGNLLALQRILGHTDIRVTMRYAHLAPDHLEEARALNPLSERANRERC